nr:retrovirus-related Pol polyprotein from transposon TNT 1-94 [Tanacetum cinerariifolium]
MAAVEVPQTLEYRGGQLNAAPVLEVENFTIWKKRFLCHIIEQPRPKAVFGDDSTCTTKGYGSIKCNGIVFTKVAFVNGLKYNLISISQLCDAIYIVKFDEKRGSIFNSNKKIVMIAPRLMMVIFLDTHLSPRTSESSTLEDNKLNKPVTSHLMKALRLSNSQNLQLTTSTLLNQKDIHLMNIFILMNLLKEDTSTQSTTIPSPSLHVPSMVTLAPQDRWSQDKYIKLVNIIGNPRAGMLTRVMAKQLSAASAHECLFVDFLSEEEPKKVSEALKNPRWVDAMNKRDETGIVIKNKARLVAQDYNQQEGINYDETFSPVARLEAIRIFFAFSTYMNFIVYQMDVKSAFLNGKLKDKVYVKQPPGFESNEFPNHICKLDKALYGLKQALRAWYLKGTHSLGLGYPKCSGFNLKGYSDSDYAGCNMDRKSTSGDIELHFIPTQYQLDDIFTKPLDEPTFKRLIVKLGEVRGEIGITTFRKALRAQYLPHSSMYVSPTSITTVRPWFSTIRYNGEIGAKGLSKRVVFLLGGDYAKIIWEDLIHKLNKKTGEKIVPYPQFISLLLEHMAPNYDHEELTINPTQVFSVYNWILKPNQPEEPPFTDHMKAICNLDVPVDSKAPKYSSPTEEETKSSLAMDTTPSHPSPPTRVVSDMHKEAQQATGGPTYLGATSEEGAHPQLSSDEPIIVSDESEEEENVEKDKDIKDTLVPPPPSPKSAQIFSTMVDNASEATSMNVPSAGQVTASPAEGEKNTKDVGTNLIDELIDLLGKDVVTMYYTKKLLFDKYYESMTRC